MTNKIKTIFFDLDGTLMDTAPDLHAAMLETLSHYEKSSIPFHRFRPHVHTGTQKMIFASFSLDASHPDYSGIEQTFLDHYSKKMTEKTELFPGMSNVLDRLDETQTPWGIVTSKPAWLTEPLLAYFQLDKRSKCVISGDTLEKVKPHPAPLLHACRITKTLPREAIYVGDTHDDIKAAKAAGMRAIAALYGYREALSNPAEWEADLMIESPLEILEYLQL